MNEVVAALLGYLLGSIPFGLLLTKLAGLGDIRSIGSGNIGATNVLRTGRKDLALATLLLDGGKGAVAVLLARLVSEDLTVIAGGAAILGHLFPVWLKFKGGKGVATGVGSFLALAPKAVLIVLLIFVVIVAAFRYISLGSIIATAAFPVFAWLLYRYQATTPVFAIMGAASLLIIAKHHQNIRRLMSGTEHKFGVKQ